MVRLIGGCRSIFAALVGGLIALPVSAIALPQKKEPPKKPGVLHVYDGGAMFTETAIDRAKVAMEKTQFAHETALTIDTHSAIPKDKTAPTEGEKAKFFQDWAKSAAAGDRAKGVYVLVCRSPGYVVVICDKSTRDRGFSAANEQRLREILLDGFKQAAKETEDKKKFEARDKVLSAAGDYVTSVLKDTVRTP